MPPVIRTVSWATRRSLSTRPRRQSLAAPERKFLLELARKSLKSAAAGASLPEGAAKDVPPKLAEKKACFVTLTKGGTLRGCIGHLTAIEPLHQAVIENARNAALRDPRFPAVKPDEVDKIKIEISVLTEPQPLPFSSPDDLLSKLHPNEDGVLLHIGPRTSTFLPQVWAQIPDKVQFLNHLAQKAGCEPSEWRGKDTRSRFTTSSALKKGKGRATTCEAIELHPYRVTWLQRATPLRPDVTPVTQLTM